MNIFHIQIDAKYDKSVEMQARNWIEEVVGEPVEWGKQDESPGSAFSEGLKNGEVLCKYVREVTLSLASPSLPRPGLLQSIVPKKMANGTFTHNS